ncbi:MAG: ABC transporter substrate-binding protein [Clostridiaceae bacterium]
MKKKLILLLVLMITLTTGCSQGKDTSATKKRPVKDMAGATVVLKAEINKAVSCWPSGSQILITLGAGEKQAAYMDILKGKSFGWMQAVNPAMLGKQSIAANEDNISSAKEIMLLNPDLVLTSTKLDAEAYRRTNSPAISVYFSNFEELKKSVSLIGQALGGDSTAKAEAYNKYLDSNLKLIQDKLGDVKNESRPTVYYVDGQSGDTYYMTSGSGTMQEDWIAKAGGKLATAATIKGAGKEINAQKLLNLNPDYIVVGGLNQAAAYNALITDSSLSGLSAVKNGKVYIIPQGTLQWNEFGTESAWQVLWLAKTIYPEKFADVDVKVIVTGFYKNFFNYDLSSDYADDILAGKNSPTEN